MRLSALAVSGLLWLAFIVYWSAAARNAAPTASAESVKSRQIHLRLMYGALLFALSMRFFPLDVRWLPAWRGWVAVGLSVQVLSGALAIWARRHLGRNWSAAVSTKVDHQLVQSGPYCRVRHPIYSGMLGMFVGSALVSGELHGLVALAMISYAYWRKIGLEEVRLREIFGDEWTRYASRSHAVVPFLL